MVCNARGKQNIVINCLAIRQKYFSEVTRNCLSDIHTDLETLRMYW